MKTQRLLVFQVLLLLASSLVIAQSDASAAAPRQPTFQSNVRVVLVDLVATNSR